MFCRNDITSRIILRRKALRFTQSDMAAMLEMDMRNYQRWEANKKDYTLEDINKLAVILKCDVHDLTGYPKTGQLQAAEPPTDYGKKKVAIQKLKEVLDELEQEGNG